MTVLRAGLTAIMLAGADGCAGGDQQADAQAQVAAVEGKRVFLTSELYTGRLGGLEGADSLCAQHAEQAGLEGSFRAWLSTANESVASRFSHASDPYVRTDGVLVAMSWADLVDESLQAPIDRDEFGQQLEADVWTGSHADASAHPSDDCEGFTSDSLEQSGQCGSAGAIDGRWTRFALPECATELRLYCFEQ